jgi:hypothetical protein
LLAYYTFALYFAVRTITVYDVPVTAEELYRHGRKILNGDAVSKEVFRAQWVRLRGLVESFYRYAYSFCYLLYHWPFLL